MHRGQIGSPDVDRLLGVQTSLQNERKKATMPLMVTLYPPSEALRVFAAKRGGGSRCAASGIPGCRY